MYPPRHSIIEKTKIQEKMENIKCHHYSTDANEPIRSHKQSSKFYRKR